MKFLSPDEGRALCSQAASSQCFYPGTVYGIKLALGFLVKLWGCCTVTWSKGGEEHRKAIKDGRKRPLEVIELTSVCSSHPTPHRGGGREKVFPWTSYNNIDQPFLTRGRQVFVPALEVGEGAEMLLSVPCGFINEGKCSQLGRQAVLLGLPWDSWWGSSSGAWNGWSHSSAGIFGR